VVNTILDIVDREPTPAPWSEGDNIPWDDPDFSERMLTEHLSQDHDLASRKIETIDRHVAWISAELLDRQPARVLDLACGPGLYSVRLARLGCECVGIDFSPASIRHARSLAAGEADLSCAFHQADVREAAFGDGFDLVMMIYGQLNVFPRTQGLEILRNAYEALRPGGCLLLEIQGREQIEKQGKSAPSWYAARSGLFSGAPHLVLQESFWDPDARASTIRFMVVDGQTATVTRHSLSNEAYTEDELNENLKSAGFRHVVAFPSLSGKTVAEDEVLPVFVARR